MNTDEAVPHQLQTSLTLIAGGNIHTIINAASYDRYREKVGNMNVVNIMVLPTINVVYYVL